MTSDSRWCLASVAFVGLALAYHTRSPALAAAALGGIFSAFLVACVRGGGGRVVFRGARVPRRRAGPDVLDGRSLAATRAAVPSQRESRSPFSTTGRRVPLPFNEL